MPADRTAFAFSRKAQMSTWLWIIGVIAVTWPVAVNIYFERSISHNIEIDFRNHNQSHVLLDMGADDVRAKMNRLQTTIEQQDELIALLWYKVCGLGNAERYGKAELAEFFHRRPDWYVDAMELPGAYDTLCRYENYPWGKHAEWLRQEKFKD